MTDTAEATSDVRACVKCESPFVEGQDDRRFKWCAQCRGATVEDEPDLASAPPEPAVTEAPSDGVRPLRLEVEQHEIPEPPPRKYYWCGATHDSPIFNITLGGVNFQKFQGEVRTDPASARQEFRDNAADGMVHHLTQAHVDLVLEHAKYKVIRNYRTEVIGNDPNAQQATVHLGDILSIRGSKYRPYIRQAEDRPIGCFVYMVEVRNRKDRPMENPPTLVERNW